MAKNNPEKPFEKVVDNELNQFQNISRTFGFASTKKQNSINTIIFVLVISSFSTAIYLRGFLQAAALEIGLLLLSVKLAYFMHNIIRFNHYLFWILQDFELKLLHIRKDITELETQITSLAPPIQTDSKKS